MEAVEKEREGRPELPLFGGVADAARTGRRVNTRRTGVSPGRNICKICEEHNTHREIEGELARNGVC